MTTPGEILDRVRKVLREEFGLPEDRVQPSSHLVDDLDFDSIDAIELAVRLEESTGIELEEDELKALRTVGDVVDLVHGRLAREEGGGA